MNIIQDTFSRLNCCIENDSLRHPENTMSTNFLLSCSLAMWNTLFAQPNRASLIHVAMSIIHDLMVFESDIDDKQIGDRLVILATGRDFQSSLLHQKK